MIVRCCGVMNVPYVAILGCLFLLLVAVHGTHHQANLRTLRLVHAFWRHGDRSPTAAKWPTDKLNGEDTWPQGWGELSLKGMQQQYALGQYLRNRYDGFISAKYDKRQVYIASTDYNRTIMSALSNLAGMFPPDASEKWNEDISWQPIPVHAISQQNDPFHADCPNANGEWLRIQQDPEFSMLNEKYADWYDFLTEKTGNPVRGFLQIGASWDPICCLLSHAGQDGHVMPAWVNQTVIDVVKEAYETVYKFSWATDTMKQMRPGPVIGDMVSRMEQRRRLGDAYKLKYFAHSGHDSTTGALLQTLSADAPVEPHQPPYFSVILVELHQRTDSQWNVELYYRNVSDANSDAPPMKLHIAGCPRPCSLDDFKAAVQHAIPSNWARVCGRTTWVQEHYAQIIATLLLTVCTLLLLLCCSCLRLGDFTSTQRYRSQAHSLASYEPVTHKLTVISDDEDESPFD